MTRLQQIVPPPLYLEFALVSCIYGTSDQCQPGNECLRCYSTSILILFTYVAISSSFNFCLTVSLQQLITRAVSSSSMVQWIYSLHWVPHTYYMCFYIHEDPQSKHGQMTLHLCTGDPCFINECVHLHFEAKMLAGSVIVCAASCSPLV